MNQKLSFILALLMLASVSVACSDSVSGTKETEQAADTAADTAAVTENPEASYTFRQDWSGEAMRILNYEDPFEMNSKLTTDGVTGEVLNDTKYSRMLTLEDKMGVSIEETNVAHDQYMSFARSVLASADDTYDFLYINDQDQNALAKEGYLMNLLELDALQLTEDWWLHERNGLITVGDTLYNAQGYANLLVVDTLNIMLFNEDLAKSIDIEMPYKLVMDGKWTLEKFNEYLMLGADLNRGADVPDTENIWN